MRKKLALLMASLFLLVGAVWAQAPAATPEEAITGLLNRIGGDGAADKFEIVINANLAENGKDVFVITSQNGKPCIKGNTQLSVATGINWYLNHYAHINLTWNNLTTDLVSATLPVPGSEEKHVCNTTYRYNFNTCTFSYSMAFWTWERWQQEIDWMALHGINAPLNLVGLDVVTRKFLEELGVSESDIDAYIAGPGFIAWFAMNNLEGWGGTINSSSTGVQMNGNPDWWYTRQEQLCRNMLQRMRELGMQPVIPGFSGQIPNSLSNYSISGFSSSDVINGGTWAGGYTRPDILKPFTDSYKNLASVYYKHLEDVMGVSEFYSMDPFHEGNSLPSGITADNTWPKIMAELDNYYVNVSKENLTKYSAPEKPKWIIQKWQSLPPGDVFSTMSGYPEYKERFIGLDLFADNIYAGNAAFWQGQFYAGCPYVYCMLHNFGGRSGMHGRLETTMDGYFQALAKGNNCQGIGATPEGIETNPILYDMLFELPWMDPAKRPTADEWLADYAHARYGVDNKTAPKALSALKNLKKSVWDCKVNQQGTSEAVILARPNWTVGSVSSWSTSAIYWDTQDVLQAADELYAIKDIVTENGGQDGIANYNYDFIDVVRQAMVDYAAELLPLIKAAHDKGDNTEYTRLYQLYLQLMLDLDTMLSYDENFKLERWTSLARNIAGEVDDTDENDRNWLEWNARTQVTVWSKGNTDLHDYSNRCWAGLIKDFHYKRWEKFFTTKGGSFDGGWFNGFEYPWTVDFNNTYNLAGDYSQVVIPTDVTATEKAAQTFGKYFGRVKGATKNYIFPMGVTTKATKSDVIPSVYRGQMVNLPLEIGKNVTISSVWVDLNNDGAKGNGETLTATNNQVDIPADAAIGKTTAQVVYSDGTDITFSLALIEDITTARTVTAVAGANGSVAIEGTNELSITNTDAVKMTATANTGYNFENWTKGGEVVSNDNPFIYYGKETATFTANFIQDKWGVVACNGTLSGDIASHKQFIHNLNFAYYNREAETIFETTNAPTEIFNTIPQIINVPQGASFTVSYDNGSADGLKYCYFRAFIDLNQDGDFDDEGELLKETGTKGAQNTAVCSGSMNVVLPYNMPLGITHMRLRFDGAWDNGNNPSGRGAKDASIRPVYELIINVTDKSDKAATVNVETNNADWGTVEVWTDETPDGSTGKSWNVSSNIPMYLRATKASEDVEFLGWYDHYGRLLTENLEHTMYAREDATYTAKFRKFLEIDGWNIEYRTEPGTEVVTTKLANGVKPEAGKTYYINADVKQTDGNYVARYLYDKGGTLATNTSIGDDNYLWTCIVNDDNTYSFRNASGKYLANDASFDLSIGETPAQYSFAAAVHEGVSLLNATDGYTGSKYMVTKVDGTDFNHNAGARNDGQWSADYVFTEVSTPDLVIFTNVRESGNNDLVIPETVDILGEQCKIVGFDNGVFNNNKDLWSITMPKSMEFLSEKSLFSHTLTGNGGTQTFDVDIKSNEGWSITMDVERTGELTGWGACLLASGSNPAGSNYAEGFQFYLQCTEEGEARDKLIIKTKDQTGDNWYFDDVYQEEKFTVIIKYNGAQQLSVNVLMADGTNATNHNDTQEPIVFTDCTIQDILQLCTNVQSTITANVKIDKTAEANPFSGCSNLDKIAVDVDCANYYVNGEGDLYNSSDVLVCSPEGKAKGAASRELAALIDKMKSLTAQVATYNPVGKATEIELSTTEGDNYYIWCNAPQDDEEGNVDRLLDNTSSTFFHSNWESTTPPVDGLDHHLTIEKVEGIETLKFHYQARTGSGLGDYPKTIKVQGSNNGTDYTDIAIVQPRNANEGTIENGAEWTSENIGNGNRYAYLRFMVTATTTNKKKDGHIYWHMAEFDLFKLTSTATLHKHFVGTALTADFAAEKYDVLLEAIYAFDHATTADEVQTALTKLQDAYTALENKIKEIIPVKFTLDENNPVLHKIIIKRADDGSKVLHYVDASKMVAVANKTDNSSWQAWYFMGNANGVTIHPYNADGKKLGATDTGNGAGKVSAVDEATYDGWTFLKQSQFDGYFNLRANNGAYFSNYGGTDNKMGFWNGDNNESKTQTDGGSLFKFVEVEFPEDNPRFYQLSDYMAIVPDGTHAYEGETVGLYAAGSKNYREAYTVAKPLVTAGNTSDADACHEAYKNLRAAKAGLSEYNDVDPNKLYIIKSVANNDYCKGKYVYTLYEPTERHRGNYTGTHDHKHLVFDDVNEFKYPQAVFQFERTNTQGEYKIKNLHTGLYVKAFAGTHMDKSNASIVKVAGIADGQVTLKIGNNDPMHAQQDYGVIVQWRAEEGNASTWVIEEADMSNVAYSTTISSYGLAGLYLNYPVEVPEDVNVTAYYVSMAEGGIAKLTKIEDGIIPANEGVILEGEPNAAISLPYVSDNVEAISENLLEGSNYTGYIQGESETRYYLFGAKSGKVGLYWTYKQYNSDGKITEGNANTDDGGYFKCTANKVYLPYNASSGVAKFSFRFDDTTGIDDLLNGLNGEQLIYDLQGRRILKVTESGIYIVNGQKRYIHAK